MTPSALVEFTAEEQAALAPYVGNVDHPVFVLTNLPEVVKGALFARYSRSAKSLRRLLLDEFLDVCTRTTIGDTVGLARAERLYARVFSEYGDDSVAQLGGAHLACEGVSNVLTKVLERGRLMSYLEQSTRYVPYTQRRGGQWKYVQPRELVSAEVQAAYRATLDAAFRTYARWIEPVERHFIRCYPQSATDSDRVYRATIRAKALDTLRGLLPAATQSNVGLYGSGQGYETLLLRMRGHALAESRDTAALMLTELRRVIPAFLTRVDRVDRGVVWSRYLAGRRTELTHTAEELLDPPDPADAGTDSDSEVVLSEFDPDGEVKVVAEALYPVTNLSHSALITRARAMTIEDRIRVLRAAVGRRTNRRHRPGRAFERTHYRFDVLADYGAFRDLQRHRMLSIDWQTLGPSHGHATSPVLDDVAPEALRDWQRVMEASAELHERLTRQHSSLVAQYAVAMAYRIRFYLHLNAREAMHVIELRTAPQGHPAYRRVCQAMHRLIAEEAGHRAIAEAMTFADHSSVELERLEAERGSERRRSSQP